MKYLGENFDIHTGGLDHIPIHHTNEIAQSEIATGKKFVNYWIHAGWLLLKGEKMAKSKGGFYTISELEEKEFNPLEFRYMCLTTHYKKPLDFSLKNLKSSKNSYNRLKNIISDLRDDGKINKEYIGKFKEKINDDLNMPKALQVLWELIRDKKANGKLKTLKKMDDVLGLDLLKKDKSNIPNSVKKLSEERNKFRKEKAWKKADVLREKISKLGYIVEDKDQGYILKKK